MRKEWKETKVNLSHAVIAAVVALVGGLFIGFGVNYFAGFLGVPTTSSANWSELDEIYDKLAKNYDGELDKSALLDGAKHGLVAAIGDTYTSYLNAKEYKDFSDDLHGNIGAGIGIEFGLRDNYIRVLRTLPDNPARRAGILAGDIIYKVNGEDVHATTSDYVSSKVRGEAGTEVTVTIYRDGEYLDFTMEREAINNVSAYVEYQDSTAIVTLTRFDSDTGRMVETFASDFAEKGIDKVILDLRNNGGGYVSAARDLLSLWVSGEPILTQKSAHSAHDQITYAYTNRAILKDMRTIVLVNGSSASASEIVAGALKDYGKATILGEKTYGKGVVQTLLSLTGGSQLKVTTAHWYTPNGTSINLTGITPDIEVERSFDDINAMRDPQLDRALSE